VDSFGDEHQKVGRGKGVCVCVERVKGSGDMWQDAKPPP